MSGTFVEWMKIERRKRKERRVRRWRNANEYTYYYTWSINCGGKPRKSKRAKELIKRFQSYLKFDANIHYRWHVCFGETLLRRGKGS